MEITKPELKKYLRSMGISVKGNHISKKDIVAALWKDRKGTIKTKEPIKIEWEYTDEMLIIKVDGIDYAIIDYVDDLEEIDMDNVKNWVEETYYSDDYKSDAYMPARFNVKEFKKVKSGNAYYYCPDCDEAWEDENTKDSGTCDDECPTCDTSYTAFTSKQKWQEAQRKGRKK